MLVGLTGRDSCVPTPGLVGMLISSETSYGYGSQGSSKYACARNTGDVKSSVVHMLFFCLYLCSGDSRAVLSRGGVAVQVTDDHKPEREDEAVSSLFQWP